MTEIDERNTSYSFLLNKTKTVEIIRLKSYNLLGVVDLKMELKEYEDWNFDNNYWVIQPNQIIEAQFNSNTLEKKIFASLVMQIQPQDEDFKKYKVNIKELSADLNINENNMYREALKVSDSMIGRSLSIENKKTKKFIKIALMSSFQYDNGFLYLKINPELKPYLLNIKDNYTRYQIKNILELKSIYSIRLYELLKQYLPIGKRTFDVTDLRKKLNLENGEYERFSDFNRYIIAKASNEINEKTDIEVSYSNVKKGRSIEKLSFTIKGKEVADDKVILQEYFKDVYDMDKMKESMGIDEFKFNASQIIDLYSKTVDFLNSKGNIDVTEDRIYKYINSCVEYTKDKNPSKSFYGYLLKSIELDFRNMSTIFYMEDMMKEKLGTETDQDKKLIEEGYMDSKNLFEY